MFYIELSPMKELNSLIIDFFRKKQVKEISWKKELESTEIQAELISKTLGSELVKKYKIEIKYQRRFLKTLMSYLSEIAAEVCGPAYEALCSLYTGDEDEYYYVFYPIVELDKLDLLSEVNTVILKENVNIITAGTTGLVTWQAAQALAEWALKTSLDNKTVLELGSGIGMSGLVVASSTVCDRYIFTDCHANVLSLLKENVALNSDKPSRENNPGEDFLFRSTIRNSKVETRKIDWETFDEGMCEKFGSVDIIFAADVVYDPDLFEPLLKTIKIFLKSGTPSAVVAFAQRDKDTVEAFHKKLYSMDLQYEILKTPEPKYLSWDILSKIHIINITLKLEF